MPSPGRVRLQVKVRVPSLAEGEGEGVEGVRVASPGGGRASKARVPSRGGVRLTVRVSNRLP